jgi:hypothetical protein
MACRTVLLLYTFTIVLIQRSIWQISTLSDVTRSATNECRSMNCPSKRRVNVRQEDEQCILFWWRYAEVPHRFNHKMSSSLFFFSYSLNFSSELSQFYVIYFILLNRPSFVLFIPVSPISYIPLLLFISLLLVLPNFTSPVFHFLPSSARGANPSASRGPHS